MIDVDARWDFYYKQSGFSKKDIHLYETLPISERQKSKKWRDLDNRFVKYMSESTKGTYELVGHRTDNIDYVMNPVDGKRYTSKAKYYRAVREAGCEIVGNDPGITKQPSPKELSVSERKADIARALESLN